MGQKRIQDDILHFQCNKKRCNRNLGNRGKKITYLKAGYLEKNIMKNKIIFIALSIFLTLFFFKLYRVYIDHFAAFGCFDECFKYVSGYFMLQGRTLYSQIYFNHQMLMAYLSALLQGILHPQSIYYLVLEHRLFVFFFGIIMDILLIARFGLPAVGFAIVFEATKFFYMGSLFLAESLLAYPLVYLFSFAWQKLMKKKVFTLDYVFAAIFTWAIVFLREPAILAALFLYGAILFCKDTLRRRLLSFLIFFVLSAITLFSVPLLDYINQVWTYNAQTVFSAEVNAQHIAGFGIVEVFLYPIFILLSGKWGFVREILIGIDILFIISFMALVVKGRKIKAAIFLLIALGLTNFRVVPPGTAFYEAFHMLPWYALFTFITFSLLKEAFLLQTKKKLKYGLIVIALLVICYPLISSKSFIWDKVDGDRDFKLGFDTYYIYGEAIKQLAKPGDTLYVEGWNELIYWQANLSSAYKYSISSAYGTIPKFTDARRDMFSNNPPDFYYTFCSGKKRYFGFLPDIRIKDYTELIYVNQPSCLFIKKSKLAYITLKQRENLNVLRFYLPEGR